MVTGVIYVPVISILLVEMISAIEVIDIPVGGEIGVPKLSVQSI